MMQSPNTTATSHNPESEMGRQDVPLGILPLPNLPACGMGGRSPPP